MTRRVRFTPFVRAGMFAAGGLLASGGLSHATDVPFVTQPPISTTADNAEAVAPADVDGDGDLDVVSASANDDTIAWYENTAGDGSAWTLRTVSTAADGARSVFAADVDGDGDMDVASASFIDNKVAWYENTAGNGTAWTTRTITTAALGAAAGFAADVDRDGDIDVVAGSLFDGTVAWHENTAGNGTAWTTRIVTTQAVDPGAVFAADVDGDGDVDILSASGFGARVVWYENSNGSGTAWTTRTISTALYNATAVAAVDLDGDGDLDVLAAAQIPGVVWYENTAGNGTAWAPHDVATPPAADDAVAADLDHDGDLDVLSASSAIVRWHENTAGNGSAWTTRTISGAGTGTGSVASADLDGDGDLDALSAATGNDRIAWHRNDTIHESACFAAPVVISTTVALPYSVFVADVDDDGDMDALSASRFDNKIAWYENTAGNATAWTTRTITTAANAALAVVATDVDGDGDMDVLSAGYYSGIRWYENTAGNGSAWTNAGVFGSSALAVGVGDVDGDGHVDALSTTSFFDNSIKWLENAAGDGSIWSFRTIATVAPGGSYSIQTGDIDGDGDLDVVSPVSGPPSLAVLWFENTAGNGSTWTPHTVASGYAMAIAVVDVDGDGDADLVTDGFGGLLWHENTAGNGTVWTHHSIDNTGDRGMVAFDLDRDGDVDVLRAGAGGGSSVSWYENTAGNGTAWTLRTLVQAGDQGTSVVAADLDGDGDPDILASTRYANLVVWYEHRGGQFSLAGTDVSPGGAANGDLVPMLRVVATHLGRAGDGDLELSTLGLLFEEATGDPLTSAEANALVENLHIYRDANGNGDFDPGTDTLVITVPTLALVNGVQTVTFADGDPNVQVALGTPRTYFVVTELTGNAGGQTPNQFQVTHLGTGPSASAAEDRTYDIALRPACPADATAAVGPITPVELLGFTVE